MPITIMKKRKSIAISNKAYQAIRNYCTNRNIASFISETILKCAIHPELANTPKNTYSSNQKRKLVQISFDAWKHLKKMEYSFIFEANNDQLPLNDIASIALTTVLFGNKSEINNETTI